MPRDSSCTKCPLHSFAKTVCIPGTGPERADIMLVGEAPGADEDTNGVPFVGKAGQELNRALNEAGLTRSSVFITNTNRCRPPQNREPNQQEMDACLPYLLEEIESVRPKVIIALGATALKALAGPKKTITAERGKTIPPRKGLHFDARLTATFHPSSVLYPGGKANYAKIVEDFRAARLSLEPEKPTGHIKRLHPPGSTDADILASFRMVKDARVFACDLEWTAGNGPSDMIWPWSRRGEPYTVSVTARTDAGLVSVALAFPLSPVVRDVLRRLLQNRAIVFHNAPADTLWLSSQDLVPSLAADTMLMAYLLDESQERNLEAVAIKYGGVQGGWKGHLFKSRPLTLDQWMELLIYNTNDTEATLLAFEGLTRAFRELPPGRKEAVVRLHSKLLIPSVPILRRAAEVGIPIDRERLKIELEAARERKLAKGEDLSEATGIPPAQALQMATSPDRTTAYLASLGIEADSSRDEELAQYEHYPAVAKIRKVRKEHKLISTYLEPWERLLERQGDGRLHTMYKITGTRTGRMSTEGEAGGTIHQAPRNNEDIEFRRLVRATKGRLLVSGDYNTIEMKITAWRADERTMLSLFQEPGTIVRKEKDNSVLIERTGMADLHRVTAAFVKRLAQGPISMIEFMKIRHEFEALVTKVERQNAKGVNFGFAFGMMPTKFQTYARTQYGVEFTLEEAEFARRAYMLLYPGLPPWHEREMRDAANKGFTETVFGRRRKFDNPDDVHSAINTPIQSTASDLTMLAMIQIAKKLKEDMLDAVIIGYIHDSVMIDVAEKDAERALQILHYTMENVDTSEFGFTLPFIPTAEAKMAETWSA